MHFFKAGELRKPALANPFKLFYEAELLAWFYLIEQDLKEDFIDVLDWVSGDVGGKIEDLGERDGLEVSGGVWAIWIQVDRYQVPEDDEVEMADPLKSQNLESNSLSIVVY